MYDRSNFKVSKLWTKVKQNEEHYGARDNNINTKVQLNGIDCNKTTINY